MPINVEIQFDQKLVHATCNKIITKEDLSSYHEFIWNQSTIAGFDRVFNLHDSDVTSISFGDLLPIAYNAVKNDLHSSDSKLAIVAYTDVQKMLGNFYQAAIEILPGNSRTTKIFHTLDEALIWISR